MNKYDYLINTHDLKSLSDWGPFARDLYALSHIADRKRSSTQFDAGSPQRREIRLEAPDSGTVQLHITGAALSAAGQGVGGFPFTGQFAGGFLMAEHIEHRQRDRRP